MKFKNYFTILIIFILSFLSLSAISINTVHAFDPLQTACQRGGSSSVCAPTPGNPLFGQNGIITRVTQLLTIAAGAISVIMIIVGGLKYTFSSGDPNNTKSAKSTVLYALVGLIVALMAQAIVIFVLKEL